MAREILTNGMSFADWHLQHRSVFHDWEMHTMIGERDECRLYNCQARIFINGGYVLLRSYSTNVAVYHDSSKTLLVCGRNPSERWSATTDQHIAKFIRWLRDHEYPLQFVLWDYVKSGNVIGYDHWERGTFKAYENRGVQYTDYLGQQYAQWKLPVFPVK